MIGVVVHRDFDGLARDEIGELFDHEGPLKGVRMVVVSRRSDLKSLMSAIDVIGILANQGQIV